MKPIHHLDEDSTNKICGQCDNAKKIPYDFTSCENCMSRPPTGFKKKVKNYKKITKKVK